ncbi:TIGR03435 family protein [Granulicella sp. L56]|nr:TIGR03435 family protein [Granulicella sp. L56]
MKRATFQLLACIATCITVINGQQTRPSITFAVSTVKPSQSQGWRLQPTLNGYTAMGVSLFQMIQEAYGIYQPDRLSGGPAWIDASKFDLEAKMEDADVSVYRGLTLEQRHQMLQALLADRFKLVVHHELKEFPAYALVVAKSGPKLHAATLEQTTPDGDIKGITGLVTQSQRGLLAVQGFSMEGLASLLSGYGDVGRKVVDKTGLKGRYDFTLRWAPNDRAITASDASGPSIFTAIQEDLGLKLEPSRTMLDTIVVDHAEKPTEN